MDKIAVCRERALQALDGASRAGDEQEKRILLNIARGWLELAETLEAQQALPNIPAEQLPSDRMRRLEPVAQADPPEEAAPSGLRRASPS
jgi:hypothetical protein